MAARLMLLASFLAAMPAWAQLADPTRPPALAVPDSAGSIAPAAPVNSGLQSVILSRDGKQRPSALINGEVVQLGGLVGESRLVQVSEDHVVLLGPGGDREIMRLTPAAEKHQKVGAGRTAKTIGMNAIKGEKRGDKAK